LGVFANNNFQRPYLASTPAIDIYYNYWTAGIGLSYNISSIYKSPRKIKAGYIGLELTSKQDSLTRQNVEVDVRNAFVKYTQSLDELQTYRRDLHSAEENYRVVENRYYNQLALLTDLIDATNTKIEAELKVTNAEINRVYSYYQLQKAIGTL
jgi:outer membrane protein